MAAVIFAGYSSNKSISKGYSKTETSGYITVAGSTALQPLADYKAAVVGFAIVVNGDVKYALDGKEIERDCYILVRL